MKVLFVSSGNTKEGISPIIKNQAESLISQGIQIEFFTIKGKGFWSYFRHISILRKHLRSNNFDIIHAHYSLTAFIATLAGARPLVVSLMGSDLRMNRYAKFLIILFHELFWKKTIVKSTEMYQFIGLKNIEIIPNGVNTDNFKSIDKNICQNKLGWENKKIHILFGADPNRTEKNYSLFQKAIDIIEFEHEVSIHFMKDIPNEEIPIYINAADFLIITSISEGSPNVIKEAMACNCPAISTDVGDVRWLFGEESGYFITNLEPADVAQKIKMAILFVKDKQINNNGRTRILNLGLDSKSVAIKIIHIYNNLLGLN